MEFTNKEKFIDEPIKPLLEVVGHQAELGVAAVLVGEAVEQGCEPVHASVLMRRDGGLRRRGQGRQVAASVGASAASSSSP